ncbi:hypothetical protein [Actinoplanes sp. NPDC051851]|uniref:hypothetical protein n=1 Tax=Actinoplanes sp. NPDC051851 TaxID=3154753 RepID=UPI00343DBB15
MIVVDGRRWGTAAEIAAHLGNGVTEHAVRWWARHNGLTRQRIHDRAGRPQVCFNLDEAIEIEAQKRLSPRGRRRAP